MSRFELHIEVYNDGNREDRFQISAKNYEELMVLAGIVSRIKKIINLCRSGLGIDLGSLNNLVALVNKSAQKAALVRKKEEQESRARCRCGKLANL